MHVLQLSFVVDPQQRTPAALLRDWWALGDIADAPAAAGVRVTVLQAALRDDRYERDGVTYFFSTALASLADKHQDPQLQQQLAAISPDVLHVHGLAFMRQVAALAGLLPGVPILLQDHADRVPRPWRRHHWRRAAAAVAGYLFCSAEQAQPFRQRRLIPRHAPIHVVPESTSRFMPGDQAAARAVTGLYGDPCVLWVGHLDHNKDPLAVLDGISLAARELPDLRMWCCFGKAPLLKQVTRRIAADPRLESRVHLLGSVAHERIETLMRAADIYVSGSHREGSGFAAIEAMACGLAPVVTDIPSFRALTAAATVGRLWPCGKAPALADSIVGLARQPATERRRDVRAHFDRTLSLPAIGALFAASYRDALARRRSGGDPP